MKHLMKVTLMALVAMFAFSTVADAQLGGLLKSSGLLKSKKQKQKEAIDKYNAEVDARNQAEKKAAQEKVYEVNDWKTGGKISTTRIFGCDPVKKNQVYMREANWRDKAMKKKIIEQFVSDVQFDNRKLADDNRLKNRKIVEVVFEETDWRIIYTSESKINIEYRLVPFTVVAELSNGMTICERWVCWNDYQGGGNYSESFTFKDKQLRELIMDWEHNPNADPLAGL